MLLRTVKVGYLFKW